MRLNRFFVNTSLYSGQHLILPPEVAHHILHVLRLKIDTPVILFNGQGGQYLATLTRYGKRETEVIIQDYQSLERESPLSLVLVQAISRAERMDMTIQKAVELGVSKIVPVLTERSPPLDENQMNKREQHWQKIIISACEQSGRNRLPQSHPITPLAEWLAKTPSSEENLLMLSPQSDTHLAIQPARSITLFVGAEGGLTEKEEQQAIAVGYRATRLGPRILRTETAAITILAICQALYGDLLGNLGSTVTRDSS